MKFSLLAIAALMATSSSGMVSAAASKSKKNAKYVGGGPDGGTGPSKPPSDSPSSYEETIDSLRAAIADLEARCSATIESLEERIVQKDSIIAALTPQTETFGVVSIDPTSQCSSYEDGTLAFDSCRCEELSVQAKDACKDVPVNCVNGYEVSTGFTCEKACGGKCCRGVRSCSGFTGYIHRDGSCTGSQWACKDATIDEVKGSCKGRGACQEGKFGLVTESCNNEVICFGSEISLIERSCNSFYDKDCRNIIATSIVDNNTKYADSDNAIDPELDPPRDPLPEDPCGRCSSCFKSPGTCKYNDYDQESCKAPGLLWCGPIDPESPPIVNAFWNNSRESCNACGGFWPSTQPANCHDRYNQDLTECGTGIRNLDGNDGIPPGDNVVPAENPNPQRL